jgi:soluble lytic murein transglycosylase
MIIQARWSRLAGAAACLWICAGVLAVAVSAQSLDALADRYRKTPAAPGARAAVLRYAEAHRADKSGALALLLLGATENDQRQFGDALGHLKAAAKRLPELADYTAYLSAVAESGLRQFADTGSTLQPVWQSTPASPLVASAALLQAESFLEGANPGGAVTLVQQHLADLPAPQAELLLARAYSAQNDAAQNNAALAAQHYQKIYVEYPLSKEAADAEAALAHYSGIPADALFARGLKLESGGDYTRAGKELTALLPRLSGENYELARVRIGAAAYLARENELAYKYLISFQSAAPEPEAERLYYLFESQRRLNRLDEMNATLEKLAQSYPQSHWRMEALISASNYYAAHDQPETAQPLYRTCAESFASDPQSAACHWKITWFAYLRDPAPAEAMLREHLARYPASDQVSPALYYLGRIAESKSDWAAARAYYDTINNAYPNYYYAILARERLETASIARATASPGTTGFLAGIQLVRHAPESFEATPLTKQRIARAHLLDVAGLDDLAEGELRFGAKADGQPQIMALELAELASDRDAPDQGIRYIKHYAPGYLSLSLDAAPDRFWRLAFPLPYRKSLEEYCRAQMLDPYLMAALIRQESEFNPKAVSRANARGLAQVMPATGRQLSRKLKIPHYRTAMLFTPDTNMKMGAYYLKQLSDELQGKWEAALASYNAGQGRVNKWMAAANYREPAEFVESIPLNETRVYVQSVLRNAEVYRKLYSQKVAVKN